jgi:hypothetical protein
MIGRLSILVGAALVAALPASADDEVLSGAWVSDVSGDIVQFTPKNGGIEAAFPGFTGTLSPSDEADTSHKLSFKSGVFSTTECFYSVIRLQRGERAVFRVVKGPETCPRGSFSRIMEGSAGRGKGKPAPSLVESAPVGAGRPARLESLLGKWRANDGATVVVRKSFSGYEIWVGDTGQGTVVDASGATANLTGTFEAGFGNGQFCRFTAKQGDGGVLFDRIDGSCPFMGAYKKVQ